VLTQRLRTALNIDVQRVQQTFGIRKGKLHELEVIFSLTLFFVLRVDFGGQSTVYGYLRVPCGSFYDICSRSLTGERVGCVSSKAAWCGLEMGVYENKKD
jgi:hypothetical protein